MEIEIKPSEIQLIVRNVIPFVFYRLEMQFNFQYPCIKYSFREIWEQALPSCLRLIFCQQKDETTIHLRSLSKQGV